MGGIILIYAPHYLPSSKANLIRLKNSILSCVYTTWKWQFKKIVKKIQLCCKKCRLCRKKKSQHLLCKTRLFGKITTLSKKKESDISVKKWGEHLRPEKQPCCDNPFWIHLCNGIPGCTTTGCPTGSAYIGDIILPIPCARIYTCTRSLALSSDHGSQVSYCKP